MKALKIPEDAAQRIAESKHNGGGASGQLEKYDQQFEEAEKKHRNVLSSFNHWYSIITHPFFICVVFCLLGAVFIITKYAGLESGDDTLVQFSEDTGTAMSYLATVIVTAVFTKFIDKK